MGNFDTALSGVLSSSITLGTIYRFRVAALNIHGWGPYSSDLVITASDVPVQQDPVSISIDNLNVIISWTAPSTNNYAPVTGYQITIKDSTGSYR